MSTLGLRPDSIQPSVFHERLVSTCAHMLQTPLATSRTCTVRARDRKRPETVHNRSTRTDYPTMSPGGRVLCGIRDRKRPEVVHNHSTHTDFPPVGVWRRETSRPWTGRVQHRHVGGFLVRLRCHHYRAVRCHDAIWFAVFFSLRRARATQNHDVAKAKWLWPQQMK